MTAFFYKLNRKQKIEIVINPYKFNGFMLCYIMFIISLAHIHKQLNRPAIPFFSLYAINTLLNYLL